MLGYSGDHSIYPAYHNNLIIVSLMVADIGNTETRQMDYRIERGSKGERQRDNYS